MVLTNEKFSNLVQKLVKAITVSSWKQRFMAIGPALAACAFSALSVFLDIYFRDGNQDHMVADFFRIAGLLLLFFWPLTWITRPLMVKLLDRSQSWQIREALLIGLYLPQIFITLIILYSQLSGSDVIVRFTGAVATWAMFSLLLTPLSLVTCVLAWSFLPKRRPVGLPEIQKNTAEVPISFSVPEKVVPDPNPPLSRLERISNSSLRRRADTGKVA